MFSTHIATQIYAKICFETTPGQKKIIEKLSEYLADDDFSKIFVLNGYAGTGKTTLIAALVGALKEVEIKPILLAPTGRAAKVLARYAHEKAHTIHKRIYRQRTNADYESKFSLNINPERGAVFIVDEASMLADRTDSGTLFGSGSLLHDLIDYVRRGRGCRLILVGDADQLPSVGPGAVLNELLASGRLPAVILDKVFRQSEGSLVAENAQRIRHGVSELDFGDDFQFWTSADEVQSAQYLMRLYKREVARFGVDNVALLTPFRKKSETGVYSLNAALHDEVNPAVPGKAEIEVGQRVLRVGDKVMQMRNRDFASNGDIGYICTSTQGEDGLLVEVDFGDDRVVAYEDIEALRQLELAYATTIHKSQGSEYDAVLINIQDMHGKMLNRALFYTAETRAKKRVIIVGDWDAVVRAIQTADTKRRHTMLAMRINELTKE